MCLTFCEWMWAWATAARLQHRASTASSFIARPLRQISREEDPKVVGNETLMLDELNYLLPVSHKSFCSLIAHLEVKVHIAKKTCHHIAIIVD